MFIIVVKKKKIVLMVFSINGLYFLCLFNGIDFFVFDVER